MAKKIKLNGIAQLVEAAGTMRRVWRESRCACGCGGTWSGAVEGTIGDRPAIWMGCSRRGGSTVGGGLTGEEYHAARAVLSACDRIGVSVDDVVASTVEWVPGESQFVGGPLAVDYEREVLAGVVARWTDPSHPLGRWDPEDYLIRRSLSLDRRGIDAADVCDGIWDRPAATA